MDCGRDHNKENRIEPDEPYYNPCCLDVPPESLPEPVEFDYAKCVRSNDLVKVFQRGHCDELWLSSLRR
jgi:hypothetical protein